MENNKKYTHTIKGLSFGLDGLDVQLETVNTNIANQMPRGIYYEILSLRNRNLLVGDRYLQLNLPRHALYINSEFLINCNFPDVMEFDSESDYGEFEFKIEHNRRNIVMILERYKNCVHVSIKNDDTKNTLLDRVLFFKKSDDDMERATLTDNVRYRAEGFFVLNKSELDDFIFFLRDLEF